MQSIKVWVRNHWPLCLVLALLGAAAVVINPLRQAAFTDDWSYALMVRHLLDTGAYQLDNWAAANPVFQVYWGALFAGLLGFSFGSLKVSTLALLAGGVGGMYLLCREHGLSARQSGLLTLVMLANPLTLLLGFSYMTDIPFLACLVLALAIYTRALRLDNIKLAVLGAVFAAAAILIRSFGAAILPGLALVWLFSRDKRAKLPLYIAASVLPLIAIGWQLLANTGTPNWAVPLHVQWQLAYVTNMRTLPPEVYWRLTIILEYLAFFSLPLIPVALAEWWHSLITPPSAGKRWHEWLISGLLVLMIITANIVGVVVLKRAWVMPIVDWTLNDIATWPAAFAIALSLIMQVGAFVYARAIVLRYVRGAWRDIPDHERLLDAATLCLLLIQITYFQFGDEYLLHLLPFALIVVARRMPDWLDQAAWPTLARALAVMLVGVLWVRGQQANAEAVWAGGDGLLAQGVRADEIHSTWDWSSYNGAFDDYLRAYDNKPPDDRAGYFDSWLRDINHGARYDIKSRKATGDDLKLIRTITYRDMLLNEQTVYVYERLR